MLNIQKNKDETISEFCYRLYSLKDEYGFTWEDITDIVNKNSGTNFTINAVKKRFYRARTEGLPSDNKEDIDTKLADLRYERTKLSDERTQINALYRRMAREDTLKEIAHDFAVQMDGKLKFKLNTVPKCTENNYKIGILCLSDVHYGLEVDSPFNKYNTEIAEERLNRLLAKVIDYIIKENLSEILVVNLGDLIAGRIHTTIRLNSRIDVITQTMEISEIVAQMLYMLSMHTKVNYVSTSDNHSRIEPIKSESLDLESLMRITDWYLKERCKGFVNFIENEFGNDIATFNFNGYAIIATHGDKDKPNNAIQNLTLLTGIKYDLCLLAHRHHFSADEHCGTVLVANGSVCGTDQFAQDLRLHSLPSQNFIIMSEDNPVECIYKINLE